MRIPNPNPRRRARIEIIPLIDIVFFLLATFVMVSLSMVKNQGINVNFPAASSSVPQKEKMTAALSVTASGEFYFNKERVPKEELEGRLAALKAEEHDPAVIINADEKAVFSDALYLLDAARKLGIRRVAIQTKKQESV